MRTPYRARAQRASATALICAIVIAGLLLPGRSAADIEYEFFLIEAFNDQYDLREVYVWDINDAGRAVGTSTYESSYAGYVWDVAGDKSLIPIVWPSGINNFDKTVGTEYYLDLATGDLTYIPGVNDVYYLTRAQDVNDSDLVVGYSEWQFSNSEGLNQFALVWDPVNGTRGIDVLAAKELLRVNAAGVAVGNIRYSAGASEAFVYDVHTSQAINLDDLLTPVGPGYSEAAAINDLGTVLGEGWNGSAYHAFLWSEAEGFVFLPGLDGGDTDRVHGRGINDTGEIVGYALTGANQWHAFIWDGQNGMRDLNSLAALPPLFILDRAMMINDAGWIVGDGHFGPGWATARGWVLRPLTETGIVDTTTPGHGIALDANHPNPFNPETTIRFALAETSEVTLEILDVRGRRLVALLESGILSKGQHALLWDGTNAQGVPQASGIYFARLTAGGQRLTRKMTMLK